MLASSALLGCWGCSCDDVRNSSTGSASVQLLTDLFKRVTLAKMLILLLPQKHLQQKLRHQLKVVSLSGIYSAVHVCADDAQIYRRLFPIFKNKLTPFLLFHFAQNRGNLSHEQHESLVQIKVLISSRLLIHLL